MTGDVSFAIQSLFIILLDLGLDVPSPATVGFWVDVAEFYGRTVRFTKIYADASMEA